MTKTTLLITKGKPALAFPLEWVTQTCAILARRRAGKTYTASVIAEEAYAAKLPFVVLDPTGAWHGLRSSADGKSPGIPAVIVGGQHADVAATRESGAVIADLIVEHPGWYIIDTSLFESHAAQTQFVTDFAKRLYTAKGTRTDPLHLFVDEADMFVPQRPLPGELAMLGAFEALVRRGGIRGIGVTLISQRAAIVSKNVLTQTELLIVLQTTGPQDRDAIMEWAKGHGTKEQIQQLRDGMASLKKGEAWVWSPSWLDVFVQVQIHERWTFNSSATPKPGEAIEQPKALAHVDLEKLRGRIAEAVQHVKETDPKTLRKRIKDLEGQLEKAGRAAPPTPAPAAEIVQVALLTDEERNSLAALGHEIGTYGAMIEHAHEDFAKASDKLQGQLSAILMQQSTARDVARLTRERKAVRLPVTPLPAVSYRRAAPAASNGRLRVPVERKDGSFGDHQLGQAQDVSSSERRLLDAIAWLTATNGRAAQPRISVAVMAGVKPDTGSFNRQCGHLRDLGLIDYPTPGSMGLTPAGEAMARRIDAPSTDEAMHERVLQVVAGSDGQMLRVLLESYPDPLLVDVVAERMGIKPNTGSFNRMRGKLKRLGLILYPSQGSMRAADELFPVSGAA